MSLISARQEVLLYKTRGLVKSDIQDMLTPTEKIRFSKVRANVDGDLSFLPSAAIIDTNAQNAKYPGATWRDLLRSAIDEYNDAPTYNTDHPSYLPGWSLMAGLGILDNPSRVSEMMLGLKLT